MLTHAAARTLAVLGVALGFVLAGSGPGCRWCGRTAGSSAGPSPMPCRSSRQGIFACQGHLSSRAISLLGPSLFSGHLSSRAISLLGPRDLRRGGGDALVALLEEGGQGGEGDDPGVGAAQRGQHDDLRLRVDRQGPQLLVVVDDQVVVVRAVGLIGVLLLPLGLGRGAGQKLDQVERGRLLGGVQAGQVDGAAAVGQRGRGAGGVARDAGGVDGFSGSVARARARPRIRARPGIRAGSGIRGRSGSRVLPGGRARRRSRSTAGGRPAQCERHRGHPTRGTNPHPYRSHLFSCLDDPVRDRMKRTRGGVWAASPFWRERVTDGPHRGDGSRPVPPGAGQ